MFNWCGIVFVRACCTPWLVVALLLARAHWHDKLEHSRILTYMISRGEKEIKRARDMTFWQKGWKCFKWFKWEVMHDEIRFITLEDSIHRRPSPHHLRCSECFKDFKFDAIFGRCFKVCPTEQTVLRHSWSLRVSIGLQWIPHDYSLLLTFWKDCPRREDPALGKLKAVTGCSRGSTECVEAMLRFCLEDVSWCSVLECLADRSTSTRPVYRIDGIRWHSKAFRRHFEGIMGDGLEFPTSAASHGSAYFAGFGR